MTKKLSNIFDKICSYENVELAYKRARKGKGKRRDIKRFALRAHDNILNICDLLKSGMYVPAPYKTSILYVPKKRTIYKLRFNPDRIVHHAIMNILEPFYTRLFDHHSYASIKGKGIHDASNVTSSFVRANNYVLKCDISKYYQSINHNILFSILSHKIKCKRTLALLKAIISSYGESTNIPVGNYLSQWLGNIYLDTLDKFIRHKLHCKYYVRYCDDFCLFSNDRKLLEQWKAEINTFLTEKLKIKFSKANIYCCNGVDYLGYRHFKKFKLMRKRIVKNFKKKTSRFKIDDNLSFHTLSYYRSVYASYIGWFKYANTYNLRTKLNADTKYESINKLINTRNRIYNDYTTKQ